MKKGHQVEGHRSWERDAFIGTLVGLANRVLGLLTSAPAGKIGQDALCRAAAVA